MRDDGNQYLESQIMCVAAKGVGSLFDVCCCGAVVVDAEKATIILFGPAFRGEEVGRGLLP